MIINKGASQYPFFMNLTICICQSPLSCTAGEAIVSQFGVLTQVDPRNYLLDGGPYPPQKQELLTRGTCRLIAKYRTI